MKLLPVIKSAYAMYKDFLKEKGLPEEIPEKVEERPAPPLEEEKKTPEPAKVEPPKKVERPSITTEQMYQIGRIFAERIFSNQDIAKKLRASNIIVSFKYYEDPDRWGGEEPEVTVDLSVDPIKLYTGPCDKKPDVVMRMHADTAHRFWMQKVNLMVAVTKGEIRVKGSIPKVMKLLPVIKPSFAIYKEVLKELGYTELLNYPPEKRKPEVEEQPQTD